MTLLPGGPSITTSGDEDRESTTSTQSPTSSTIPPSTTEQEPDATIVEEAGDAPSVVALVGSDSRSGLDDLGDFGEFGGQRADVIMLAIRSGEELSLLSIPRDLLVEDTCRSGRHRIGDALAGCGDRHGLAQLVEELEHTTGLPVEHAALVDLAGLQSVVDALGGYQICTEQAVRDPKSGLELAEGCETADGETTLAWLRSRYTQRRTDGGWETVPGVSDLTRNRRQREFVLDMFDRLSDRSNPRAVLAALREVAPHLTIDDQLSISDAAAWLWDFRNADVETEELPVRPETTSGGAEVLVPEGDIERLVDDLRS